MAETTGCQDTQGTAPEFLSFKEKEKDTETPRKGQLISPIYIIKMPGRDAGRVNIAQDSTCRQPAGDQSRTILHAISDWRHLPAACNLSGGQKFYAAILTMAIAA